MLSFNISCLSGYKLLWLVALIVKYLDQQIWFNSIFSSAHLINFLSVWYIKTTNNNILLYKRTWNFILCTSNSFKSATSCLNIVHEKERLVSYSQNRISVCYIIPICTVTKVILLSHAYSDLVAPSLSIKPKTSFLKLCINGIHTNAQISGLFIPIYYVCWSH